MINLKKNKKLTKNFKNGLLHISLDYENGNVIKETSYKEDGTTSIYEFSYDDNNNVIKEIHDTSVIEYFYIENQYVHMV